MPALSAADRAQRRADLAPMITSDPVYVTIARPPAVSGRQRGNAEPIAADVPMQIWPADGQTPPKELQLIPVVAGQRVSAIGYALHTADIKIGDEVWASDARYKVVGAARWNAVLGVALNEVKGQAT